MAYAGICGRTTCSRTRDPYFSERTQTEVSAYVNGGTGSDNRGGFQVVTTTNHNPDVTAPRRQTIPVRTPFVLTGSATDSDNDPLIYLWEQNDRGAAGATSLISNTKLNGPLFRVFGEYASVLGDDTYEYNSPGENLASNDPSRTFPDMDQILAGDTNVASGACPTPVAADFEDGVSGALKNGPVLDCFSEFLPTAAYVGSLTAGNASPPSLDFRLTARDMKAGGGGTDFADVKLTINPLAGPFSSPARPRRCPTRPGAARRSPGTRRAPTPSGWPPT